MKYILLALTLFVTRLSNAQPVVNEIVNGDFSNLTNNWTISSPYWWISNTFSCYASPTAYAYVGNANGTGANNTYGSMYQTVTIPANATSAVLLFSLSINTDETTPNVVYDNLDVQLRDQNMNLLYTFASYTNLDGAYPSGSCQAYASHAFNVPATYFGQTLRLNFQTASDAGLPTKFRLDDVSLSVILPCTYTLSPGNYSCPNPNSATYSNISSVTAATGCNWTATVITGSAWLHTSSTGNGNGYVSITVDQNTSPGSRTGTIDVGGQTLTVTQPGINCSYNLSPANYSCANANAATYSNISTVTAATGCTWSAAVLTGTSWLHTSSTGNGNGFVSINVDQNISPSSRTGTIDVGGQILTITQPGVNCNYSVSPGSYSCINCNAATYNNISTVTAPAGCSWAASVTVGNSWLQTSSSGNGNGSVSITVDQNISPNSRTGTIDVAGQTITVTQPGCANQSPDLLVYSPQINIANLVPYASAQISYSLKNNGNGTAGSSITSFFLSTDNVFNAGTDIWIKDDYAPSIAASGTANRNVLVTIPNGTPAGTWYILMIADAPASISESDETNNMSFVSIDIGTSLPCNVDDYPFRTSLGHNNAVCLSDSCTGDTWNFCMHWCTSYVAWKVNEFHGYNTTNLSPNQYPFFNAMFGTGNNYDCTPGYNELLSTACRWDDLFASHGVTVNDIPAVGAIAHWNPGYSGPGSFSAGHVAFVESVQGNIVCFSNYNGWDNNTTFMQCDYGSCIVDISQPYGYQNRKPEHYIHVEANGLGNAASINNEKNPITDFSISPNPSNGRIKISIQETNILPGDLIFYNSLGQVVLSSHVNGSGNYDFDLSNVAAGLYLVQYKTERGYVSRKIEITR